MLRASYAILALLMLLAAPARAEFELSVYSGWQTALQTDVEGDVDGVGRFDFNPEWEGRSFEPPFHYGFRATWWRSARLGFGVDFNHVKVYGDDDVIESEGFDSLELTDGLNIITANVMWRFPLEQRRFVPYVGAGLGIAVPHVDVETSDSRTFEYQYTGPAAAWMAGVTYPLTDSWSVFGEYKGTYSSNSADLEGGGELEADILTNAVNLGVSFNF